MRRALVFLAFAFAWLFAAPAFAFVVPELTGRVVDPAGKLSSDEKQALDDKLAAFERDTTNQIAVFVAPSLGGESIEDVSYKVAKTWKLGQAGKDNGVLLTIAPAERKIRIETGKGVGDRLPDLRCNDIIRNRIGPELKQERFYAGIDHGVDDIIGSLQPGWTYAGKTYAAPTYPSGGGTTDTGGLWIAVVMSLFFIGILVWSFVRQARGGGGGSSGWTTGSSSWSSSSDSSWSSGGDSGGSSFSGGGGDFGGGGSSDSY